MAEGVSDTGSRTRPDPLDMSFTETGLGPIGLGDTYGTKIAPPGAADKKINPDDAVLSIRIGARIQYYRAI